MCRNEVPASLKGITSKFAANLACRLRESYCALGGRSKACLAYLRKISKQIGVFWPSTMQRSHDLAARNLAFAERTFAIQRPIELTARVDRVYDDGHVLKLLELKTRTTTKVYLSDVFELSAQRLAVRSNTGREVSDQGYVLLLHPVTRRESLHRVDLLPESSVLGLAHRRQQLMAGLAEPARPQNAAVCKQCEYAAECARLVIDSSTALQSTAKSPS
jgi:hypothetical protein